MKLRLSSVESLEKRAANIATGLKIFLADSGPVASIANFLKNGGKAPVRVILQTKDAGEIDILLGERFSLTPQIKAALKAIPGVVDVQDL